VVVASAGPVVAAAEAEGVVVSAAPVVAAAEVEEEVAVVAEVEEPLGLARSEPVRSARSFR
jgi:hypothetical protein